MMRKLLMAAAVFAAAAATPVFFAPESRAQGMITVAQPERDFYFAVLRAQVLNAPNESTVRWARDGRSGTVRFSEIAPLRTGDDCFQYFLREIAPVEKAPVEGRLCTRDGRATGYTGGNPEVTERGSTYELIGMRPAAAAGPRSEPSPSNQGTRGIVVSPPPTAGPTPPPAPVTEERPRSVQAPPPRPGVVRRGVNVGVRAEVNIKPVLVQIGKRTARANQNGGHAVVLLTNAQQVSARNLALCEALLSNFDDAPLSDILVGVRREPDGTISALRAIYWPVDDTRAVTGDSCTQRLRRYDFTRAATIRDKHRLTGPGPYLLVSRNDEQQAAAINLAGMSPADIEKATLYFRDAFSQKGNIWNPQGYNRQREEQTLVARWGAGFSRALVSAVEFYSGGPASAATPARACIGDLTDTRSC